MRRRGQGSRVLELKISEDDYMLLQALEYLDFVKENVDRFASFYEKKLKHEGKDVAIGKDLPSRVILIAPSFSDTLRKSVKCVKEDYEVKLKQLIYLRSSSPGHFPYFMEVEVPQPAEYHEPTTIDDHVNYVADKAVRALSQELIDRIQGLREGVTCVPR